MIEVSVIVPYYGERAALGRCLQALAGQTLDARRFEVIVVNNLPAQRLALGGEHPGVSVVDEPAPGSYAARNRGASLARGRWLAFTDADCIPDQRWLEAALGHAARHDPLGGHIRLVRGPAPSLAERYDLTFGLDQQAYVEKSGFAATANLFVSRGVFERVGPFDARLRSAGDWEWCVRAARQGHPVAYCAEAVVAHRTRGTWREIVQKALRVQGGMRALQRELHLALAPGALRQPVDAIYPRRYAARLLAMKRAGDRAWWRLYLAACLVNFLAVAESCRLRLGGTPLR